eukprot:s1502_g3.t2
MLPRGPRGTGPKAPVDASARAVHTTWPGAVLALASAALFSLCSVLLDKLSPQNFDPGLFLGLNGVLALAFTPFILGIANLLQLPDRQVLAMLVLNASLGCLFANYLYSCALLRPSTPYTLFTAYGSSSCAVHGYGHRGCKMRLQAHGDAEKDVAICVPSKPLLTHVSQRAAKTAQKRMWARGEAHPTPKLQAFINYCEAMEGLVTSSSSSAARSYLPQKRAAETASCQEAKRISLEYPGPAALADLTKKLQDEAEQRRLEAEKRKLELSKEKALPWRGMPHSLAGGLDRLLHSHIAGENWVKSGFLQLLREEAGKIEKLMKDKGMENDVQTGLLESLEEKIKLVQVQEGEVECQFFYNPFRGADEGIGSMNTRVMSWLRSFDTKRFQGSPCYAKYVKQIDFQPLRILDWALTFYRFFLNGWMEDGHSEAGNVREHVGPQQRLISYLLLQSLDPVTPDLKLMIEERLQKTYRTTCPDVVAIFGSKILPRIRKTLEDEEFARLSKQNLTKACVFESQMC